MIKAVPNFDLAKNSLIEKLTKLDLTELNLSEYSKNYLGFLIGDIWETLSRFEQVLREAISHAPNHYSSLTIVDYGGGTGLLSLLAKETGFKSVIYNDIFDGSCRDVEVLAKSCILELDSVVQGDATELVDYLNKSKKYADLIVSYDVIEHVYNVKSNFYSFSLLDQAPQVIIYGSGANIRNPFYVREVKRTQIRVENIDREESYGHKSSDSLKSYTSLRKDIIMRFAPTLRQDEVDHLARGTRGLIKSDVENIVKEYIRDGKLNYKLTHPTNTCDPMTGNWCEHLLDFKWLISTGESLGYQAKISKGIYSPDRITKRNSLRFLFNLANITLGKFGFMFSPFYMLTLKPASKI